jgi:hypothetical protein
MTTTERTQLEIDHERWLDDYDLRKREVEIKERDQSRSRWSSPVILAVLAAGLAGIGNATVTWLNAFEQRKLEADKAIQAKIMEETKAEAARIFEVIKTGDADKAATNLKFLVDTGLITNSGRIEKIHAFLEQRPEGRGPTLPVGQSSADREQMAMMLTALEASMKKLESNKDANQQLQRMLPLLMPPNAARSPS